MSKTTSALAASIVTLCISAAHADYHTVLVGARLHLSTTNIHYDSTLSTQSWYGYIQVFSNQTGSTVVLPSNVLEGYITRASFDPPLTISSSTKPSQLGADRKGKVRPRVGFVLQSELVRLKHPRQILARTGAVQGLFIPIEIIDGIEGFAGKFAGDQGMGEPFWLPTWQAALMSSDTPPVASCTVPSERGEPVWISYNKEVGENELASLCKQVEPDAKTAESLVRKGNVFPVFYPAD